MKKNFSKNERAITLVALVITIIILIILAGISISMLIGKDGIINRSKNAGEEYKKQSANERLQLAISNFNMDRIINGKEIGLEYLSEMNKDDIIIDKDASGVIINYDEENELNYATAHVNGYEFRIYENNKISLVGESNEPQLSEFDKLKNKYVQDGLLIWYDAKYNTKDGYNPNATVWENLVSPGTYDGIFKNIQNSDANSGWNGEALLLDGTNDWVLIDYYSGNNSDITIEIVAKPKNISSNKYQFILGNCEVGGIDISSDSKKITSEMYISGYKYTYGSEFVNNKIYSLLTCYDSANNTAYLRENDQIIKQVISGTYKGPDLSTKFAIGTNPKGSNEDLNSSTQARFQMEVYSVRIYNKILSENEMKQNYNADKARFNISE